MCLNQYLCVAPSSPPLDVKAFILNDTSIKVNWTISSQEERRPNGYVIEYTTGGVSTTHDNEIYLSLSMKNTYTISVYSYVDLPSVNSTQTVLRFDGKFV